MPLLATRSCSAIGKFTEHRPVEMMTSLYRGERYRVHMSPALWMASKFIHAGGSGPPQKGMTS